MAGQNGSCGCAAGGGGSMAEMGMLAAEMSAAVAGLGLQMGGFVSYPGSSCADGNCAASCYKSQSQRYMMLSRGYRFQGVNVAAGADPLAPLFALLVDPAGGNPVGPGVGPRIFNNDRSVDKASLHNLYVWALRVRCSISISYQAAPNPTGGAGAVSNLQPLTSQEQAICFELLNTVNLGIYPTADTREAYVQQTPLAYYASGGDFKRSPAVRFCDQDATLQMQGQVNQYQAPPSANNALPTWPGFLPVGVSIFGSLVIDMLTMTDPNRCPDWVGSLCGGGCYYDPKQDQTTVVNPSGGQTTTPGKVA